jgi:hypothetical protein
MAAGALFAVLAGLLGPVVPVTAQSKDDEPLDAKGLERLQATLDSAVESPRSPDDRFGVLVEARIEAHRAAVLRLATTQASEAANLAYFTAVQEREKAQRATDAAVVRRDTARRDLAVERRRLSDLTVRAYVLGGDYSIEREGAVLRGDTTDPGAGRELMFTQVLQRQEEATAEATRVMNVMRVQLNAARKELAHRTQVQADRKADADRLGAVRGEAEQRHEKAVAETADAERRLRAGGGFGIVPEEVPLVGLPRLTPEDLAGWFSQTAYRPRVSTPIRDYAQWFIDEGMAEGIRGDIAFAQAVLETGGFANNDSVNANNFSGIGHCDTCPSGWTFPSPRLGVRAQIQLLKSYAVGKPDYYTRRLVDPRLRGPAGCCPTWGDLTTVWATDPTYGPKVMLIYSDIVAYAVSRRAAGAGFDDEVAYPELPDP